MIVMMMTIVVVEIVNPPNIRRTVARTLLHRQSESRAG